jgi:hypothetical protein
MSFPPGTEMFQFPGFASRTYGFSAGYPEGWVSPFGHPRINDRSHLPAAFRSVPRPSSPLGAKASTERPCLARHHPPPPARRTKPRPAARDGAADIQAKTHTLTLQPIPDSPVKEHPPGHRPRKGAPARTAVIWKPVHQARPARRSPIPQDKAPGAREWRRSGSNRRPPACKAGALPAELRPHTDERRRAAPCAAPASRPNARLPSGGFLRSKAEPCSAKMGQGGLEPPTPRLSSVCSNQLSYWPAGPGFRPRPQKASRQPRPDTHPSDTDPKRSPCGRRMRGRRRSPEGDQMPPRSAHQRAARPGPEGAWFRGNGQARPRPLRGKATSLERLREQARCQDRPQPRDRRPSPHDPILERR